MTTTFAKATGPERAEKWRQVFGTDEVPIVSPVPHLANLPGFDEPQRVYLLALSAVTPGARARLVQQTAERFGLDTAVVDAGLENEGMPILADQVIVTSTDYSMVMNLIDESDNDWSLYDDIDDWPEDYDFENDW
jgi:hypothetical protein